MYSLASMVAALALVTTVAFQTQASETTASAPMTVQEHLAAAQTEAALAQQHRQEAKQVSASKPVIENALRRAHLWQADKHDALARQHRDQAQRVAAK